VICGLAETGTGVAHWTAMILTGFLLGVIAAFSLGEVRGLR